MNEDFAFDPNSTINEGRWRLRDPSDFEPDSYFRKPADEGVSLIIGKLRGKGTAEVQAIRFDRQKFSAQQAAGWWDRHRHRFVRTWSWGENQMPVNAVKSKSDEEKWEKAKGAAASEGQAKKWPLVMHIFQNMKGNREESHEMAAANAAHDMKKRGR